MHFLVHDSNLQQDVRRTQSNAQLGSFCPMDYARGRTWLYCRHAHPHPLMAPPLIGHNRYRYENGTRTQSRRRDTQKKQSQRRDKHTHTDTVPTTWDNTNTNTNTNQIRIQLQIQLQIRTILIKYAFKTSIQFWSRRDNSVVPLA